MASMSHCCIENTNGDLSMCIEKMNKRFNDILLNPYEKSSLSSLYEQCKEFIQLYEEYQSNPNEYALNHSENENDDWEDDDDW